MGKEIGSQKNFILVIVLLVGALVVASYFNSDGTGDVVVKRPSSYGYNRASAPAGSAQTAAPQQRINVDPNTHLELCTEDWKSKCELRVPGTIGSVSTDPVTGASSSNVGISVTSSGFIAGSTVQAAMDAAKRVCEEKKAIALKDLKQCIGELRMLCPRRRCLFEERVLVDTLGACTASECAITNTAPDGTYSQCFHSVNANGEMSEVPHTCRPASTNVNPVMCQAHAGTFGIEYWCHPYP